LSSGCAQSHLENRLAEKQIEGLTKEAGTNYFLVFGDWGRNGQGDQQDVADWMGVAANQLTAKFVISTGDNFYCCGVASTEDYQWLSSFEQVYRSHSLQIPWYVTLGNHDYQGNVQAQIDYSKKNQRWKMPDRYYTTVRDGIRYIFLDTSPLVKSYYIDNNHGDLVKQDTTKQLHWLDSVLLHSPEKTKIVAGHHPLYSVGNHGGEIDLRVLLEKRFEKYHIIYFAGHDHNLQSLQLAGSSVHYIISGGGSEHTPVKTDPLITKFAKSTTGFLVVGTSDKELKLYYINKQGQILYKEIITR
jgi:tartrate-resistant acid phosphatase type 5